MKDLWNLASSLWRFFDHRDQLLIVSLHRVNRPHGLPASTVEKSLKLLTDQYRFVLPKDLQDKGIKGKMAMLTVDDGHTEVYSTLYPIIRSLKISIAICITTDFVLRNQWLWFDKLRWIFERPDSFQQIQSYTLPNNLPFSGNLSHLSKYLKTLPVETRDQLIDGLAHHCMLTVPPEPTTDFRPVKTTEIKEMLKSGMVELVSHTMSHPILMNLSDEALEFELQHSKKELETIIGGTIHAFCYPNGLPGDYDERTKQAVNKAGYAMAFSSCEGINYKGNTEWNQLKRIHIHRRPYIFNRSTSGLTEALNRLKRC